MTKKLLHFEYDGVLANINLQGMNANELADLLILLFTQLPDDKGRDAVLVTMREIQALPASKKPTDLNTGMYVMIEHWRQRHGPPPPASKG